MGRINSIYLYLTVLGLALFVVFRPEFHRELSFYGFAESRITEINYNYAVVVDKILVKPGQKVKAGQVIMNLSRRKSKETLADQGFQIAQLKAEESLWIQKKENELEELKNSHRARMAEIEREIVRTEKEIAYKKSLLEDLQSIQPQEASFKPLEDLLTGFLQEKTAMSQMYESKLRGLTEELSLGRNPYTEQIRRYTAERQFEESQQNIPIQVIAPSDGLIGNISCKEEEHIQAYSTLLTFYEPHSGIIEGYVHEDLTLQVEIGQQYTISSLKDETISFPGKVIGLGSRIVEIPSRLRKIEAIKAYGREVLIEISTNNSFLQSEKVSITQYPGENANP